MSSQRQSVKMGGKKRGGGSGGPRTAASHSQRSSSPQSTNHTHNGYVEPQSNRSPPIMKHHESSNQSNSQSISSSPLAPSILPSLLRQLQCLICDNPFDETSRKPMILHAGHTVCQICVHQFRPINPNENDIISCPLCQQTVRRSEAAVNHVVLDIVKSCGAWSSASPSSASESSTESCDLCLADEVESDAAVYCFDCLEWLCEDHARIHNRKKDKSSHRTNSFEQIQSDARLKKSIRSKRFPVIMCQKHELKLEFYCVPCGKFLCLTCATDHSRHAKEDLFVRFNQQSAQSTELIQAFGDLEHKRQNCLKLVDENVESLSRQESKELTDIAQTIESINQLLEKAKTQEQKLASQLEEQIHSERSSWQSRLQSTSAARDQIATAISELEKRITAREYLSIAHSVKKLKTAIEQSRAALAPLVDFETKQFSVMSDAPLKSVVVDLAQQLDIHMQQWFTSAPSDYSIEKFIRIVPPAPAQSSKANKQPKKKSKMAKAAANFAAQQLAQAKHGEQKAQVAVEQTVKVAESSSSVVVKRASKTSWTSLYQRIKSHLSSPFNPRQLLALAEDLRMFSLNRNLDIIEIDECEFEEAVMFIRSNLVPKHLALFSALADTLINLLSVCTMDCTVNWCEDEFAEIMQICMRILRPVNQLSIQFESLSYAIAHRIVWALPGNRLAQTLKANQKIGMYKINFNDRIDALEGLVVPLKLNPSLKAITATEKPLTEKALHGLITILGGQPCLRSLALNLAKAPVAAVGDFFDSLKQLQMLSSLQLKFGFATKPILGSYLKHLFWLTTLQISAAQLGDDGVQVICDKLVQMPNLRKLFLGSCGIGNKGFTTLGQNLHKIPLLRHLSLTVNKREDESHDKGTQALIAHLKHLPHLSIVELQYVQMKDASFKVLGDTLKFLPRLQELRLSCTDPNGPKAGFQNFCQNLHFVTRMKVLDLGGSNLDSAAIDALSTAILNGSLINLDFLNLGTCDNLKIDSVRRLTESFIQLTALRELYLSFCQLDASRCVMICEQFKHLPNLRHLDLSNNNIGGAGCRSLADNLRYCPLMETLTLETCTIDDAALRVLSLSLVHVPALQFIDLSNNKITNVHPLAESLVHVPQLRELSLSDNLLSDCTSLLLKLKSVPELRSLSLSRVGLSGKANTALLEALKYLPLLRRLDLSCNKLSDSFGVALAQNFKNMPLLHSLILHDTAIGNESAKAIRANVKQMHYLRLIDMSGVRCRDATEIRALKKFLDQYHTLVTFLHNDDNDDDDEDDDDYSDSD